MKKLVKGKHKNRRGALTVAFEENIIKCINLFCRYF